MHRPTLVRLALGLMTLVASACATPTVDELARSAVRVEALPCGRSGVGSGAMIGDGLVLTNAHLIAGSTDDVKVRTWDDRVLDGVVVGFDEERDLALISVANLDGDGFELGEPGEGEAARVLARPLGLELEVLEGSIARLINATGDDIYGEGAVSRRAIELSVDVVPGASGAGVVNAAGELVGVVFAESRRRPGVSYAIAASEVVAFIEETDTGTGADTLRCRR